MQNQTVNPNNPTDSVRDEIDSIKPRLTVAGILVSRDALIKMPLLSAIARVKHRAEYSDCPAAQFRGKMNVKEVRGSAASLRLPRFPAIIGVDNLAATPHAPSRLFIYKENSEEFLLRIGTLALPDAAAVSGMQNHASLGDCPSFLWRDKMRRPETLRRAAILRLPLPLRCAIAKLQNRTPVAHNVAFVPRNGVNINEKMTRTGLRFPRYAAVTGVQNRPVFADCPPQLCRDKVNTEQERVCTVMKARAAPLMPPLLPIRVENHSQVTDNPTE